MAELRHEGTKRKWESPDEDFEKTLGPMRWHVTRKNEEMSTVGRWNSDWGTTEERAAVAMYGGKLWEAITPLTKRHLKNVYCGRKAWDRERLAAQAVRSVYVVENDFRWSDRYVMQEEYRRREWVQSARSKLMSLDRCSNWYTSGQCKHGRECKFVHIG